MNDDTIEEMIGPVCKLAALQPTNKWPADVRSLVGYARRVKDLLGFEVVTFDLNG